MAIEITSLVRIQQHSEYWYTVEDTHLDVGCDGCTISYWELPSGVNASEKRVNHICMGKAEALSVADAIYKLFKKN
jgi:hypothetical protein